jgi:hypothetical protein
MQVVETGQGVGRVDAGFKGRAVRSEACGKGGLTGQEERKAALGEVVGLGGRFERNYSQTLGKDFPL